MGSMVYGVVADGLLAFWREVKERGGDEVGGLEDLEVALGGVVALGAVDDGLGGGDPGFLLLAPASPTLDLSPCLLSPPFSHSDEKQLEQKQSEIE